MSILVVGSVAYDTVDTPSGSRKDSLGGSAMYFSLSSSYFTGVSLLAVVGDDFDQKHIRMLESHGVDVSGLERRSGKTFRWSGVYETEDLNTRSTLDTQLNVFAEFSPKLTDAQRRHDYLFLANIDPELQLDVLGQMESRPRLVALDSMNFWIEGKKNELNAVISNVDVLFLDEGEAKEFAGQANLVKAARHIMSVGPKAVVIKRGEHGVLLFNGDSIFAAPAFPLETVVDPTGAGDSFAGGFMGYLAATDDLTPDGYRRAAALGSVMGSFCVEDFSADRIGHLSHNDIESRFREFADISSFIPLKEGETLPKGHS